MTNYNMAAATLACAIMLTGSVMAQEQDKKDTPGDATSSTGAAAASSPGTDDKPGASADAEKAADTKTEDSAGTAKAGSGAEAKSDDKKEPEAKSADAVPETKTAPSSLTVASWGGAYTEAQKLAYFKPFEEKTGIAITMVSHKGQFAPLTGDKVTGWDIVDLDQQALDAACSNGKLEKVAPDALAQSEDGKPATADFIPGTLHECGVPSVAWSSAIVFDKRAFKKGTPASAADFFDAKRFPGARALPRDPRYVVELALVADGVKPGDVYETLTTGDGLERAFKQLDRLKDNVTWWHKANQPLRLLAKEQASMALAYSGRIFSAIVAENRPFGIVWDGQVYNIDFWAIPSGSAHKDKSLEFIAFATRPENLARQASWFPYGPLRKSAVGLVSRHPVVKVDMAAYLPTSPENFKTALRFDTGWWEKNGTRIHDRYVEWMDTVDGSTSFEDEPNRP